MATVGNLFVNVGASTKGLEQGLKKAQNDVKAFADKGRDSMQSLAAGIPGLGDFANKFSGINEKIQALKGSMDMFRGGVAAAAKMQETLTKAIEESKAADQALASAKGSRKNIGMAREMLAKQGIDPNKAAAALKIEDTSTVKDRLAAATKRVTEAQDALNASTRAGIASGVAKFHDEVRAANMSLEKATAKTAASQTALNAANQAGIASGAMKHANDLAAANGTLEKATVRVTQAQAALNGAQAYASKAASGKDPMTGQFLSAAKAAAVQEQAAKNVEKAQTAVAKATMNQATAQQAVDAIAKASPVTMGLKATEAAQKRLNAAVLEQSKAQQAVDAIAKGSPATLGIAATTAAQQRLTAAIADQTKAQQALEAVRKSNQAKEATRGKLNKAGIDLTKGQDALKLPGLEGLQNASKAAKEKLDGLRSAISTAAGEMKLFGLPLSSGIVVLGGVAIAAVAATAGLLALTKSQARAMDALKDTATAAGMNVEAFQQMQATYMELGVGAGVAETASQRLGITLEEAARGGEEAREKLQRVGLAYEQIGSMSPDKALQATIDHIRELGTHRERMAALRDLFGKSGIGLAAAVNATNEEFRIAAERAAKLVIPAAMVEQLAEINDKVEAASKSFENMKTMLASQFAPVLSDLADSIFDMFTADPSAMIGAFQSIAAVCAVVYDLIAAIVNALSVVVNLAQALGGVLITVVASAIGGIIKGLEYVVKAFEYVSGSSSDMSDSLNEAASISFSTAGEAAVAAGRDIGEGLQRGLDAVNPNATIAVINQIGESGHRMKSDLANEPIALKVSVSKSAMKEVETTLQGLRDKLEGLKFGEDSVATSKFKASKPSATGVKEFEALNASIALQEKLNAFKKEEASINDTIEKTRLSEIDYLRQKYELQDGFNDAQIEELVKSQQLAIDYAKYVDRQKEIAQTTKDLQTAVDQLGMSEMQILEAKLKQNGATDQQIKAAMALQGILESAKTDKALQSHFDKLNDRLLEAQGAEQELMKRQLENMGLTGDALKNALQDTLAINEQIANAEKAKTDALQVASTLEDLTKQLEAIKLGEAGVLEKKLTEAGASSDDIQKALAMQAEIKSLQDAKSGTETKVGKSSVDEKQMTGVVDAVDSALGSFKIAGNVSAGTEGIQRSLLKEADRHTELLTSIANASEAMAQVSSTATGEQLMAEGASTATMKTPTGGMQQEKERAEQLMKESNTYLKQIASNTLAFAGVLT